MPIPRWVVAASVFRFFFLPLYGIVVLSGFSVFIWTLVAFAQGNPSGGGDCLSREAGNGFSGNSDFYGLGIRLGIYLQWWASLIANYFRLDDRGSMFAGHLVFSIALLAALLMLTFQHACTFTVEIIVVLFIYWGGIIGLFYSTDAMLFSPSDYSIGLLGVGKSYALRVSVWIGTAFSAWFWLRLATSGEVDFQPSPGGTSYFFFSRVSTDTKAVSRFIVFLCFLFGWIMVNGRLRHSQSTIGDFIERIRQGLLYNADEEEVYRAWSTESTETDRNLHMKFIGVFCFLVLSYSITAIELTLVWNSVLGIYSVASTGQVIPLVAGLGLFVNAIWKLAPWNRDRPEQPQDSPEVGQEVKEYKMSRPNNGVLAQVSFQNNDGTWQ